MRTAEHSRKRPPRPAKIPPRGDSPETSADGEGDDSNPANAEDPPWKKSAGRTPRLRKNPVLPVSMANLPSHLVSPRWSADPWLPVSFKGVILLTFFDGIASAVLVAVSIGLTIHRVIAWETEKDCCDLSGAHFPFIEHWGDFRETPPQEVSKAILEGRTKGLEALVTAGPPCPAFSRILEGRGGGRTSPEGHKFQEFCEFLKKVEEDTGTLRLMVENVVPHNTEDAEHFENLLGAKAMVIDAADWRTVSRPRLWWIRSDWPDYILVRKDTPGAITRGHLSFLCIRHIQYNDFRRAVVPTKSSDIEAVQAVEGATLPTAVANGSAPLPCLTTAARTEEGRAPPSGKKCSEEANKRWLKDNRQFAPWHYEDRSILTSKEGNMRVPTPAEKEVMHHLPAGYTAKNGWDKRRRASAIGNGWHIGAARVAMILAVTLPLKTGAYDNSTCALPGLSLTIRTHSELFRSLTNCAPCGQYDQKDLLTIEDTEDPVPENKETPPRSLAASCPLLPDPSLNITLRMQWFLKEEANNKVKSTYTCPWPTLGHLRKAETHISCSIGFHNGKDQCPKIQRTQYPATSESSTHCWRAWTTSTSNRRSSTRRQSSQVTTWESPASEQMRFSANPGSEIVR